MNQVRGDLEQLSLAGSELALQLLRREEQFDVRANKNRSRKITSCKHD